MRPSDGGPDPVSNGGNTWHFKLDGIYAGPTAGLTLAQVKAMVEPTQPAKVTAAGASFERATQQLVQLAAQLAGHAAVLASAWGGANAPKVVAQFQQLHETAVSLANTSQGTGAVLSWYGTTIMPFYKSQIQNMTDTFGDKVVGFLTGTDPANTAATAQLTKLNTRTVEAYAAMPPAANKNLPPLTGSFGSPGLARGTGVGGTGSGYVAPLAASPSGSRTTGSPSRGPVVGGPVIGGRGSLAGFSPPPGAAGGQVGGIAGPGAPGGPGGALGGAVIPGPIIGGPPVVMPGLRGEPAGGAESPGGAEPVAGDPVVGEPLISGRTVGLLGGDNAMPASDLAMADGQPGAVGTAADAAGDPAIGDPAVGDMAAGAAGVESPAGAGTMLPLGGTGQAGNDRERRTWLTEDRDVWSGAPEVTPAVID